MGIGGEKVGNAGTAAAAAVLLLSAARAGLSSALRWLARKLSTCSRMSLRMINYINIHTKRKKDSYIFDSYSLKHSVL